MKYEYKVVEEEEILRIHDNALGVLSEIGMKVLDDSLRSFLSQKGLMVDNGEQLVHFPKEIVQAALNLAPESFIMSDHNGNEHILKAGNALPAVYANAIKVWDWNTKKVRPSTIEDIVKCVHLAEVIPEIKIACPVCLPNDSPKPDPTLHAACILMQNSSKIYESSPQTLPEAVFWTEALAIADQNLPANHKPTMIVNVSPTSPLQIDANTCQVLRHMAERKFPLILGPCPLAGGTSPVTMAGTTVQSHAEILAMLTIAQLISEGLPVVYGGSAGPLDLRSGALCYGVSERNTMLCANIDIANYFHLPHFSAAGTVDSAEPDFQAGASKALTFLTRLMKGTTLGIWFGSLLTGSTVAPEQIVLDADLYRSVQAMLKGMIIDDEHLAYDVIKRVVPGGDFLADEHTLRWMRDEYYYSPVVNHDGEHGKSMLDRAHDEVERLLKEYTPAVSEKIQNDLETLLNNYSNMIQCT